MAAGQGPSVTDLKADQPIGEPRRRVKPPKASIPAAANWLGALGALPFVMLAVSGTVLEPAGQRTALVALVAYGAVILSFLGGVHWGLAIAGFGPPEAGTAMVRRLSFSVVPALVGWSALLLPMSTGFIVLASAFALLLIFDFAASRFGEAPSWYPQLRWPLTAVVVASLSLGLLA